MTKYTYFLKERGRSLSEINPGSDEIALKLDDALQAIELLKDARVPILGGDILSDVSGTLSYTYENWYCEKIEQETPNEYIERSYQISRTYLSNLILKKNKNDYAVFVI